MGLNFMKYLDIVGVKEELSFLDKPRDIINEKAEQEWT